MVIALIWTITAILLGISLTALFGWFPGILGASIFLTGAHLAERISKKKISYFGPFTPAKLGVFLLLIAPILPLVHGKKKKNLKIVNTIYSKNVDVSATTDKTYLKVEREKLLYTVKIRYPKNIKIEIPDITKHPIFNGPFVMPTDSPPKLSTKKLPDGRIEKVWKISLIPVITGPLEIPKFEVTYWIKKKKFTATIPSIAIEVGEYQNQNEILKKLAGPKKPILPELPLNTPQWVWWSLAAIGTTAAILSLLIWINRKEQAPPPIPPELWINRELIKLQKKNLLQKKMFKEYYFALSEIFRGYLERRFSFPALERTAQELAQWTKNNPRLTPQTARKIRKLIQEMDRIKFADEEPTPDEQKKHQQLLKEIVSETTPKKIIENPNNKEKNNS